MLSKIKKVAQVYDLVKNIKKTKSSDSQVSAKAFQAIENILGSEKGLLLKIAQFTSTKDQLPDEFTQKVFKSLNPVAWPIMKKEIEKELGQSTDSLFKWVEPKGITASLSQVHKAQLMDGRFVAIKVQYPEIHEAIHEQLTLLNLIPGAGPISKWGIPIEAYKKEISDTLFHELDYQEERKKISELRNRINSELVLIPKVYPELSTNKILTMDWLEGMSFDYVYSNWSQESKLKLSELILSEFFKQIFLYKEFQSDFNAGNFLVDKQDKMKLIYLDFGSFINLPDSTASALLSLVYSKISNVNVNNTELLVAAGFNQEKIKSLGELINPIVEILLLPFSKDEAFNTTTWEMNKKIDQVAGELKWWFRSAGSPQFFHFLRAYILMISILNKLGTPVNWQSIFLKLNLVNPLNKADLKQSSNVANNLPVSYLSTKIIIHVYRDDEELVKLTLPIHALDNLIEIIPEDIQNKLIENKVNVEKMINETRLKKAPPGLLFSTTGKDNKTIKIILE